MDEVALGQGFLRVHQCSTADIIPPMLHAYAVIYDPRYVILAAEAVVK